MDEASDSHGASNYSQSSSSSDLSDQLGYYHGTMVALLHVNDSSQRTTSMLSYVHT